MQLYKRISQISVWNILQNIRLHTTHTHTHTHMCVCARMRVCICAYILKISKKANRKVLKNSLTLK